MFLLATAAFASEVTFFHAFFSQRFDVIVIEIMMLVGWFPAASVILWGLMEVWKDYRQGKYEGKLKYILLAVDVPKMTEQSPKSLENFFASLQGAFSNYLWKEVWFVGKTPPRFTFEIVSIDGYIQFYIRCEDRHRDIVESGIYAQYPDSQITEVEDYMTRFPSHFPDPEWEMWGAEMTIKSKIGEFISFKTWQEFEHSMSQELKDPLAIMLEQISRMRPGECFIIQIVTSLCNQKWTEEGSKFIKKTYGLKEDSKSSGILDNLLKIPEEFLGHVTGIEIGGGSELKEKEDIWRAFKITLAEKAQVEAVANKISKIGLKSKIRLVYYAKKGIFAKHMRVPMVKGMLLQYNNPGSAEFGMFGPQVPKNDYFFQRWTYDHRRSRLSQATKNRSYYIGATPRILCTEELATLYHFPSIIVKAPLVKKTESRRAEPPVSLPVASEETPLYRATPPALSLSKKEAPPVSLPGTSEPDLHLSSPLKDSSTPNEIKVQNFSGSPVGSPSVKKIPDAIRVLLDPSVELEDVNLPPIPGEAEALDEKEKSFTPPNLPF
ncbi:MAG: hypothetical protein V1664_05390 [Candidatus Uhrbacteria bacterium]